MADSEDSTKTLLSLLAICATTMWMSQTTPIAQATQELDSLKKDCFEPLQCRIALAVAPGSMVLQTTGDFLSMLEGADAQRLEPDVSRLDTLVGATSTTNVIADQPTPVIETNDEALGAIRRAQAQVLQQSESCILAVSRQVTAKKGLSMAEKGLAAAIAQHGAVNSSVDAAKAEVARAQAKVKVANDLKATEDELLESLRRELIGESARLAGFRDPAPRSSQQFVSLAKRPREFIVSTQGKFLLVPARVVGVTLASPSMEPKKDREAIAEQACKWPPSTDRKKDCKASAERARTFVQAAGAWPELSALDLKQALERAKALQDAKLRSIDVFGVSIERRDGLLVAPWTILALLAYLVGQLAGKPEGRQNWIFGGSRTTNYILSLAAVLLVPLAAIKFCLAVPTGIVPDKVMLGPFAIVALAGVALVELDRLLLRALSSWLRSLITLLLGAAVSYVALAPAWQADQASAMLALCGAGALGALILTRVIRPEAQEPQTPTRPPHKPSAFLYRYGRRSAR